MTASSILPVQSIPCTNAHIGYYVSFIVSPNMTASLHRHPTGAGLFRDTIKDTPCICRTDTTQPLQLLVCHQITQKITVAGLLEILMRFSSLGFSQFLINFHRF